MATRKLPDELLGEASKLFKTLGDLKRLSVVYLLKEQEYNVTELSGLIGMEQSAMSHQLKLLKDARLIEGRREGKAIYYHLKDHHVVEIIEQVLEHASEEQHE